MNKHPLSNLLYIGFLLMLTSCQAAGQPWGVSMFKPGDTIDGMSLTTGAQDAIPLWAYCDPAQSSGNAATMVCAVPRLSKLAIGHFLMPGDDTIAMLDWSEINWELTIDNQPVDLESFGTYEFALPAMSHEPSPIREVFVTFTAWDVVLTDLHPGVHTIQGSARMGSDSYRWVIHLTIEGNDLGGRIPWVGPDIQSVF